MKSKISLILFILTICIIPRNGISQDSSADRFRKGAEFYSAGEYDNALIQWMELYNTGYRSANLYYNIGNANFKINNTPGAILFYERAHLLKPADEDINYNLQIARTRVVDRFEEIPVLFFIKWYDFLSLLVSSNSWARISIISFILCLMLLSLYFYTSVYRYKVLGFWFAILFFVISLSSLAFTFRNKSLVFNSKTGIIFSPLVNGKSSPDSSGTDLFVLHEGTKVTVEDEVGQWFEIRLSDGNKGWVPVNSLEIL
jgi:tetratricopeptide (TPR) repeat protein